VTRCRSAGWTRPALEDLTWLLLAAMKGGALIIYRFAIHAER